jgi:hypothetical protein
MRFVVPGLVFIGALACFWASFTSKTIYQADADKLLAAPKPMPPWRARIFWMFCGLRSTARCLEHVGLLGTGADVKQTPFLS